MPIATPRAASRVATPRPAGLRAWRGVIAMGWRAGGAWGGDGTSRALDASTAPSARMSTLSLRIDVTPQKQPALSILGFRAAFSGVSASDVMTLVDPLADPGPGRDCQVRDIGRAASALASGENGVELEEFGGVGITVGENPANLRLSPRLFPDISPAIGGVVSEAGPFLLGGEWPAHFRVTTDATPELGATTKTEPVPRAGQFTAENGQN